MAKDKNSFILYADYLATVSKLTDAKAGKLFKTILEYVNDLDPQVTDNLIDIVFGPIKQQLKRDLRNWEEKKTKRSEAGKEGGKASAESRRKQNEAKPTIASNRQANEAVIGIGTVNVIDTVIEKEREPDEKKINVNDFTPQPGTIVGDMRREWERQNQGCYVDDTDNPALLEIAGKVGKWLGLTGRTWAENSDRVLKKWPEIVTHCKADPHLSKYSISQVNKHFSSVIQSMNNGNKNGKDSGGKTISKAGRDIEFDRA